ncbi:type II toxin-antitoxin system RelE/ParE family toxin [Nitratifractor sp.]|uniref:type II toxin-antitoxin system RelE/ParE family toxin n=1 Tax=Nitratifractor sp. TaxID=2268144 RepID=UPI0025D00CEE|nr:type II toxin-antitoxin system RelE/ParE family toxin [Nitratifractor sp.]
MIEYSENFLQEARTLSKKYRRLKQDLQKAIEEIEIHQDLGIPLGHGLFKKRMANSSIPTGKSGGFRIIIYRKISQKIVLISIYSKTHRDSLSDEELRRLLDAHFH